VLKIFECTKKFNDKDMLDRFLERLISKAKFDFLDIFFIVYEETQGKIKK
jgi:hypothetical protein